MRGRLLRVRAARRASLDDWGRVGRSSTPGQVSATASSVKTALEAAAVGDPREWSGAAGVERLHHWLGAVLDVVDPELDVEVGCAAAAGVAGHGDLLSGGDLLAFVDEDVAVVAVRVAEAD